MIDESKSHGLQLFRLAESLIDILVHESVMKKMIQNNFIGLTFTPV
jgi:hypothetical protein